MSRLLLLGGATVIAAAAAFTLRLSHLTSSETVFAGNSKPPEAAPACPWREPEDDLKYFFPRASHYELETRSLSALRLELAARLGRPLEPEENLLRAYRIDGENSVLGTIMTRRVKGSHGAMEIVLATDVQGKVCGLRIQRIREPEEISVALNNPEWLRQFDGKTAESSWEKDAAVRGVPAEAGGCAQAIAEDVRTSLILLESAPPSPEARPKLHH